MWRGFSAYGQTAGSFSEGKIGQILYKYCMKTISSILIPFAKSHDENDFDFKQNTAPIHT